MRRLVNAAIVLAVAGILGGMAYLSNMGQSMAQTTQLLPITSAVTATTGVATQLLAANPTRNGVEICNTGSTNPVWIWAGSLAVPVSFRILAPISNNSITCYQASAVVNGHAPTNQWNSTGVSSIGIAEY